MNKALEHSPVFFRSQVTRTEVAKSVVRDAGAFNAGLITGVSVISVGEAVGHGKWVDKDFIVAASKQLKAKTEGVKSRYTHPDMSGDGLGKGLGRVVYSGVEGDSLRGDVHFWKSAHNTPEGNLAEHVMQLAEEDPKAFGISITFEQDLDAMRKHFVAHGGKISTTAWGEEWDDSGFRSPDPNNTQNLPHVVLKRLRTADIVGDPAANPNGLFDRNPIMKQADTYLAYALGLDTRAPAEVMFGVDPERASGFVSRFLSTRGLKIVNVKELGKLAAGGEGETLPTVPAVPVVTAELSTTIPAIATEPVVVPTELNSDPRAELKRYLTAFGSDGAGYYADGLSFEQAQSKHIEKLTSTVKQLQSKIELAAKSEGLPLSSGGGDVEGSKTKTGFKSKIKIREQVALQS